MSFKDLVGLGPQIGPYLSGIALMIAAAAAWNTYIFYHKRTMEDNWVTTFRALYGEFWNNEQMAQIRKYLSSDEEYQKLDKILTKRLEKRENSLSSEENDVLERLDRFCATMVRVLYFGNRKMSAHQAKLYDAVFTYWKDSMVRRKNVHAYITKYWTSLSKLIATGEL
jgi:hypothetical protein